MSTRALVSAAFMVLAWSLPATAGCSEEDTFDKMMTVADGLDKLRADNAINDNQLLAAHEKINRAGEAFGNRDYNNACRIYDEIAKENGIAARINTGVDMDVQPAARCEHAVTICGG